MVLIEFKFKFLIARDYFISGLLLAHMQLSKEFQEVQCYMASVYIFKNHVILKHDQLFLFWFVNISSFFAPVLGILFLQAELFKIISKFITLCHFQATSDFIERWFSKLVDLFPGCSLKWKNHVLNNFTLFQQVVSNLFIHILINLILVWRKS